MAKEIKGIEVCPEVPVRVSALLFVLCAPGTVGSSTAGRDWAGDTVSVVKTGKFFFYQQLLFFAACSATACLRSTRAFPVHL